MGRDTALSGARVTVFRTKYVKGWPRHNEGERGYVVDLGAALERPFATDAHFAAYASGRRRRLTSELLDGKRSVMMTAIVFDVDCPGAHGTGEPAPEEWRVEQRLRVLAAEKEHPAVYGYDSKGGLRFLWRLPCPIQLRTPDHAKRWAQDYAVCCAYFERRWGIVADPACADWQRLYRLPRATREERRRENRPLWGNPQNIGKLNIQATPADMKRASELLKRAFQPRRMTELQPCTVGGEGLFFEVLRVRGDIDHRRPDGSYVIRCPNESNHTTGRTADGSTLLYPPGPDEDLGLIHCLHSHCSGLTVRRWLALFPEAEINRANKTLGRCSRGRAA